MSRKTQLKKKEITIKEVFICADCIEAEEKMRKYKELNSHTNFLIFSANTEQNEELKKQMKQTLKANNADGGKYVGFAFMLKQKNSYIN